jgi:hypothetical protein
MRSEAFASVKENLSVVLAKGSEMLVAEFEVDAGEFGLDGNSVRGADAGWAAKTGAD